MTKQSAKMNYLFTLFKRELDLLQSSLSLLQNEIVATNSEFRKKSLNYIKDLFAFFSLSYLYY